MDFYIQFHPVTIFHQPNRVHIMGQGIFASQLGSHPTGSLVKISHCNLVSEANLVHNVFSVYLSFVTNFRISTVVPPHNGPGEVRKL